MLKMESLISQFFVIEDMGTVVAKLEDEVFRLRSEALEVINLTEPPLESHCYKPKTCPCKNLCHPNLGEYPVYDLSWWKTGQIERLVAKGYQDLVDISEEDELNHKQLLQLRSIKQNKPIIDRERIKRELFCWGRRG